jgi:hypothetical protein
MYSEASSVLRAVVSDFFFNCCCLEIRSDNHIQHVPGCVYNRAQNFRGIESMSVTDPTHPP